MNRILSAALALAIVAVPVSVRAEPASLRAEPASLRAEPAMPDLDAQSRCAAFFAIIANQQRHAAPGADRFPAMAEIGSPFFVETGLRLMRERKLGEDALKPYFVELIAGIQKEYDASPDAGSKADAEMASCLEMNRIVVKPGQPR